MKFILAFLLSLFSFHTFAQSCNYQFDQGQINVNFVGNEVIMNFTMTVSRPSTSQSPSARCDVAALFFSTGQANSYNRKVFKNSSTISYQLENINPTGTLKNINDATGPNEYLSVHIGNNQTKQLQGIFRMPMQNMPGGSGHYQDRVRVDLYGYGNPNNPLWHMQKELVINVQTQSVTNLSIVPVGAPHDPSQTYVTLNMGSMYPGLQKAVDVMVHSNIGYSLRVSSQNNGRMRHTWQNGFVPYEMKLGGNTLNLSNSQSNPVTAVVNPNGSVPGGDRFNVAVKIGNIAGQPLGDYQDNITFTMISN